MKISRTTLAICFAIVAGGGIAVAQPVITLVTPDAGVAPTAKIAIPLGTRSIDSTKPARHIDESADWVKRRYLAIESDLTSGVSLAQVRVLFVGDSITQFYLGEDDPTQATEWRAAYADPASPNYALNLGSAGDRTENVLLRLLPKQDGGFGHLDDVSLQPQIIVLMIGINNTWSSRSDIVKLTFDGQMAVIRRLQSLRPNATLIVNSVLPTNNRTHNRTLVEQINRRLAQATGQLGSGVVWLDVYPAFLGADGNGDPALFKDGVHPNSSGYSRWSAALSAKLDEVRASRGTPVAKP